MSRYDQGPKFNVSDTRSSTTSNLEYTLVIVDVVGGFTGGNSNWDLEITGTISSYFLGDIEANRYNNDGILW